MDWDGGLGVRNAVVGQSHQALNKYRGNSKDKDRGIGWLLLGAVRLQEKVIRKV